MKKWALWALTSGVLVAAFFVMSAAGVLKQPLSAADDVLAHIEALDRATDRPEPDWDQAEHIRRSLKEAWERVRVRVQFVAEKDDIVRIGRTIDELKGAIYAQDFSMTKRQIETLRSIWEGMR